MNPRGGGVRLFDPVVEVEVTKESCTVTGGSCGTDPLMWRHTRGPPWLLCCLADRVSHPEGLLSAHFRTAEL